MSRYKHKTLNGKKQPIHRHIVEEIIGRKLELFEHVYHLDGDPDNNEPENLVIIVKHARRAFTKKGKKNDK